MSLFFHRVADIIFRLSFLCSLSLVVGSSSLVAADLPAPAFSGDKKIEQSDPYLTLEWGLELPENAQEDNSLAFELQMAPTKDFADPMTRYRGPDASSFIAGLAEGDYFFRVRSVRDEQPASAWSDPMHVTIEYTSLTKAFLLFGLGAVVSISTIVLVITGDRRTRREEAAANLQ